MNANKGLYFIALLPPADIAQKVTELKKEFADRYHSSYALKVLPHITLQPPFTFSGLKARELEKHLTAFAREQYPFDLQLQGFGAFNNPVKKVIYVNVISNKLLRLLHKNLKTMLKEKMQFTEGSTRSKYVPHMTIAYRDLKNEFFDKAWPVFRKRPFSASFPVDRFYLLKHNGAKWEPLAEFKLSALEHTLFA